MIGASKAAFERKINDTRQQPGHLAMTNNQRLP
jgi:hypothetical protein